MPVEGMLLFFLFSYKSAAAFFVSATCDFSLETLKEEGDAHVVPL
jgi:hypothetical protein